MKFCLVDRITELTPGESIEAVKNVTLAEEYLQDHFPGFAILPGVFMVEAMVQTCAWLSRATDDFSHSLILLKQARAVRFNNFLKPGQTLQLTARMKANDADTATFQASGTVDGTSAVSAKLVLSKQNLAVVRPSLADRDARILTSVRDIWEQIRPTDG